LVNPGAKLSLGIAMGNSPVYAICVAWLDDFTHDAVGEKLSFSGRNAIGYFLKAACFGNDNTFTGTSNEVITELFDLAGVPKYEVMLGEGSFTVEFNPSDNLLTGFDAYNWNFRDESDNVLLRQVELADGTVVSGDAAYIETFVKNSFYSFVLDHEVFRRKTKKSADGAYSGVYATGTDSEGNELTPVEVAVEGYQYWKIPAKKLKFITPVSGSIMDQAKLQTFAEAEATRLQYVGIGDDFTGPMRPQLLVGDVAEITNGSATTVLGIITEVRHNMGMNGFTTQFSVDIGGDYSEISGGVRSVYTRNNGYNRATRITDIVGVIADEKTKK
jgi:hypothetical protein